MPNYKAKLLWYINTFDGIPEDGIAEYDGRNVYFSVVIEDLEGYAPGDQLRYDLYDLPADVMDGLCELQKKFAEMVGSHTYHDPKLYVPYSQKPTFSQFYEENPKGPSWQDLLAVGTLLERVNYTEIEYFKRSKR